MVVMADDVRLTHLPHGPCVARRPAVLHIHLLVTGRIVIQRQRREAGRRSAVIHSGYPGIHTCTGHAEPLPRILGEVGSAPIIRGSVHEVWVVIASQNFIAVLPVFIVSPRERLPSIAFGLRHRGFINQPINGVREECILVINVASHLVGRNEWQQGVPSQISSVLAAFLWHSTEPALRSSLLRKWREVVCPARCQTVVKPNLSVGLILVVDRHTPGYVVSEVAPVVIAEGHVWSAPLINSVVLVKHAHVMVPVR